MHQVRFKLEQDEAGEEENPFKLVE